MREAAMMREAKSPPPETSDNVHIRRFGGQSERKSRERRFAIEPGATQACAGQEVSDGFQAVI